MDLFRGFATIPVDKIASVFILIWLFLARITGLFDYLVAQFHSFVSNTLGFLIKVGNHRFKQYLVYCVAATYACRRRG